MDYLTGEILHTDCTHIVVRLSVYMSDPLCFLWQSSCCRFRVVVAVDDDDRAFVWQVCVSLDASACLCVSGACE